jgi:hypothetical protein
MATFTMGNALISVIKESEEKESTPLESASKKMKQK